MFVRMSLLFIIMSATAGQSEQLEERARELDGKVMAPCCWTQPVSHHYSPVADEIRQRTRQMLAEGKSGEEILDYYVSVYGERILASPRPRGFNLLAWVLPWVLFLAGAVFLVTLLRYWIRKPAVAAGTPQDSQVDESLRIRVDQELKDFE
jgi:cytochrome c-type biogenesis protein CcmH